MHETVYSTGYVSVRIDKKAQIAMIGNVPML